MSIRQALHASALAGGLALAGVFGIGLGAAAADPGRPCDAPGAPACDNQHRDWARDDNRGPGPVDWQHRGIDQARGDHQPFNWNGQQVTPMRAGNGGGWGFWFLGTWIPL
jgi:hypothetical protein